MIDTTLRAAILQRLHKTSSLNPVEQCKLLDLGEPARVERTLRQMFDAFELVYADITRNGTTTRMWWASGRNMPTEHIKQVGYRAYRANPAKLHPFTNAVYRIITGNPGCDHDHIAQCLAKMKNFPASHKRISATLNNLKNQAGLIRAEGAHHEKKYYPTEAA